MRIDSVKKGEENLSSKLARPRGAHKNRECQGEDPWKSVTRQKQSGPSWGGQNWRPGRESGTWFRHSDNYGPLVHHGDYIFVVREKKRFSQAEWLARREAEKKAAAEKSAAEGALHDAQQRQVESAEKLDLIERLTEEVSSFLALPDWTVSHKASAWETRQGPQAGLYEAGPNSMRKFHDIEWTLSWRGKPVWAYNCGSWRNALHTPSWLEVIGRTEEEVLGATMERTKMACVAACVLKPGDELLNEAPAEIWPHAWTDPSKHVAGAGPVEVYPLTVSLKGKWWNYLFSFSEAGAQPQFKEAVAEHADSNAPHTKYDGCDW